MAIYVGTPVYFLNLKDVGPWDLAGNAAPSTGFPLPDNTKQLYMYHTQSTTWYMRLFPTGTTPVAGDFTGANERFCLPIRPLPAGGGPGNANYIDIRIGTVGERPGGALCPWFYDPAGAAGGGLSIILTVPNLSSAINSTVQIKGNV